ncbi:IucA/IucC family protein [Piscirickettsia salmonis]|uniref:IucA/IucC family protein n=1 Tax=Piscirickettsia salmonis TaxID=1238 RepID=UPI0007C89FC4|nr:N(2)-citryl-N(6)-acetyl-N(6)-hydroxylysine synthase [Piscirickettsiaceae bacterium NZ-RLO1]
MPNPNSYITCPTTTNLALHSNHLAERYSIQALLNCYCREVAAPHHWLSLLPLEQEDTVYAHLDDRASLVDKKYQLILTLPDSQIDQKKIVIAIRKPSLTYHFSYISSPIITSNQQPLGKLLNFSDLTFTITNVLAKHHQSSVNLEFIQQAMQSCEIIEYFLKQSPHSNQQSLNFIQSEQSLIFGHEFHPTPKARQGFTEKDIKRYSPELSEKFQLYYFKVSKNQLKQYNKNNNLPPVIIEEQNHVLYPTHPWQAHYLLSEKETKQALIDNNIQPIGLQGDSFAATSSVRTLFQENHPYFYKFSLNVRLTNCIRKNSVAELKTAVELTHILNQHTQEVSKNHPNVTLLNESYAFSLKLADLADNPTLDKKITESFGFILRDNPLFSNHSNNLNNLLSNHNHFLEPLSEPLLAGALFSSQPDQYSWVENILIQLARYEKFPYETIAVRWFNRYISLLVPAILDYYLYHGITFEPHLQNVLIQLDHQYYPSHIYLRDLEGTKLNPNKNKNISLNHLDQPSRTAITYDSNQSWQRIIYCLFINNISSSIHFISKYSASLEKKLWLNLSLALTEYQKKLSNQHALELRQWLYHRSWPYKANLTTRFLKQADKKAHYIALENPLLKIT